MTNLDSILKSRDITLTTKVHLVKVMVFPVVMYGCDSWSKESWALMNWCFWTVMLEKTLESPLDCKELQPVHPKGNQSWTFIVKTDAEAPILWPPDAKIWLIWKDPDAGKIEGRRRWGRQNLRWLDASPTQGTRVWVDFPSWWWTGRPGVLWFMGSPRVGHDWATELNWYFYKYLSYFPIIELLIHFSIKVVFAVTLKPWSNLCFFIIWEWTCDLKNKVT